MRACLRTLLAVTAILTLSNCGFETVDTGNRGIWVKFGEVIGEPQPEGLYFYNPFIWDMVEYPVRETAWHSQTEIFTVDTQAVDVEFSVVYYPDPKQVGRLYKEIGYPHDLEKKIIQNVVLGSIKDAIGKVKADDLVGQREAVAGRAFREVREALATRAVIVTGFQLTDLKFGKAYREAVEAKVVATQEAAKAVNVTVTIREQAKQTVATATAEAEAMRIKSAALSQNKGLIAFEWVQKWDGHQPQIVMGGNSIPMLDMSKLIKAEQ